MCRFSVWDKGKMWLLTEVPGWDYAYFIEYISPSQEYGSHIVQFLGNPRFCSERLPKEPPVLSLAFTSRVDFRKGNPVILFVSNRESCSPYTAEIPSCVMRQGIQVFEDGELPLQSDGSSRRLTADSWEKVTSFLQKSNRKLSLTLN